MSQQRNTNDDLLLFFLVLAIIGALGWGIWFVFRVQITEVIRWLRWGELWVAKLLVGDSYGFVDQNGLTMTVKQWRDWLRFAPVSEISNDHIGIMTQLAVPPLKPIFLMGYVLMGIYVYLRGGIPYRRKMSLETLMKEQAKSFPAIRPFLKFDPRKMPSRAPGAPVPSKLPLFSEALSPEEWLTYNQITVQGTKIDVPKTWQALLPQLGKRWEGSLKLPLYAQGLYAAFALKHARKRKDCEALLNALACAWSPEKGFKLPGKVKSQIKAALKDPKIGGALEKYTDQHAWDTTALLRALFRARQEGGVLAPAEFLWLRGVDRALWYPLNNLGRKSFHPEAAGALVHFTQELIANQKIPSPRFDDVVKSFEEYLKTPGGITLPPLETKDNKK